MTALLGPNNPVTWAQFQRKGGTRTMLNVAGGYLLVISAAIFVSARLDPVHADSVYAGWSMGLLGIQAFTLVLLASGRIAQMIRADVTSGMIESIRMMPAPDRHVIAGYLGAVAAQFSGMFVATLLVGWVTTSLSGLPPLRWLAANLILLAFAIFTWTIAAFLSFQDKKQNGSAGGAAGVLGFLGNPGMLNVAPGLVVLAGPLIGGSIFNLRTAQTDVSIPLIMSLCCQALVGSIFFTGACRKYRRPDSLALGGWLALALLASFVLISVLSIVRWEEFQPGFMSRGMWDRNPALPFLGSCGLCMLVALAPLCNFARLHVIWLRHRADDPALPRPVPPPVVSALLITLTLSVLTFAAPTRPPAWVVACTLIAFAGFSLSITLLAAWVYRILETAKVFVAVWIVVYCVLPIAADVARHAATDLNDDSDPPLQLLATFSPVGLLIETWNDAKFDLRPGAAANLLIPVIPGVLYLRHSRKRTLPG